MFVQTGEGAKHSPLYRTTLHNRIIWLQMSVVLRLRHLALYKGHHVAEMSLNKEGGGENLKDFWGLKREGGGSRDKD